MEWKTAWSYLAVNYNTNIGTVNNITQRTFFENNLNGTKIKVKFSNSFSNNPLILEHVTIGKKDKKKVEIEGLQALTYQGSKKIVINPGKELYSDEIAFPISAYEDIVFSLYVKEATEIYSVSSTWSARSWNTKYGLNGNFVSMQKFAETDSVEVFPVLNKDMYKANTLFGITEIKLYTDNQVKTVAVFGDSITHMSYYSDALIKRLYESYPGEITVINRGLGGNRLLRDYSRVLEVPGGGTIFGSAGVQRFYKDIYSCDQPEIILVLIGINDFVHPYALKHYDEVATVNEYQKGITELISIAHQNGSKIMIGTITPFRHEESDWFSQAEDLRKGANGWIRNQKLSDGIMDFDMATRKPEEPEYMLEDSHLGDGLHPNYVGGKRMANVVLMEWFKER
ncbi:MAG: GDSL-type esterase/lipase family protein [Velocimicrobium sp.]